LVEVNGLQNPVFKLEKVVRSKSEEEMQDFEGPLDLILYLLGKNKMEIQDISISLICDQYMAWLARRQEMDLEVASEFVTMASQLVYIKTRMLLSIEDEEAQSEMDALIASLEERKRNENYAKVKLRPSTFKTSQGFLKNHIKPQIGSVPLADLTSLDLQRFYKHLLDGGRVDRIEAKKKPKGLAPKTVRNIHQMIGSAYNLAMEQKLVSKNPTQGCALPKVEHKEMKTLTADQLSAFFQEAKDSGVYELYYLDLATGLRRGELLGLKWTDVDLDRGILKIQRAISRQNGKVVEAPLKTKNAYRTLPLSADAISVLKMQKCKVGNSEWVFPSPAGGPMSPDSVLHMLQRVLKRAGLPRIRFHDLRHTFATMALQNGVDVKTVSSMLGHYSAGFTLDTYAHVTTDAQLKAAQTMGSILSRAV